LLMMSMAIAEPVPYAPTAADAVPAAILGKGGKPAGTPVGYFPGKPEDAGLSDDSGRYRQTRGGDSHP
jgi:hypothetical protein